MKFVARLINKETGEVYPGEFETESFETAETDAQTAFGEEYTIETIYPEKNEGIRLDWYWWKRKKRGDTQ